MTRPPLKLGWALAGDEQRGADLVQDALERTLLRWQRAVIAPRYYEDLTEVDAGPQQMIDEVRRGARRRRNRRQAASIVAAVWVLVVGLAVGGSLLSERDPAPEAAPHPTQTPWEPNARTPTGEAYAVDAGGDRVLATVAGAPGCGCTELWRLDESGWEKVHEFPEEFVERLELAQDGRLGLAAAPGGDLWSTRDGGETWTHEAFKGALDGGGCAEHSYLFTTTGDERWPAWAVDAVGRTLWRFNGDYFERASYDELGAVQNVWGLGGRLVVQTWPQGEGSVESGLFTSIDDGRTWSEIDVPCPGETAPVPGPASLWMTCPSGQGRATVYRFAQTWEEFGSVPGAVTDRVALTDDTLLVLGDRDVLVTVDGNVPVDTGLDDESVWTGTVLGEPGFLRFCEQAACDPDDPASNNPAYLATTAGLLVSEDGASTWHPITGPADRLR